MSKIVWFVQTQKSSSFFYERKVYFSHRNKIFFWHWHRPCAFDVTFLLLIYLGGKKERTVTVFLVSTFCWPSVAQWLVHYFQSLWWGEKSRFDSRATPSSDATKRMSITHLAKFTWRWNKIAKWFGVFCHCACPKCAAVLFTFFKHRSIDY